MSLQSDAILCANCGAFASYEQKAGRFAIAPSYSTGIIEIDGGTFHDRTY